MVWMWIKWHPLRSINQGELHIGCKIKEKPLLMPHNLLCFHLNNWCGASVFLTNPERLDDVQSLFHPWRRLMRVKRSIKKSPCFWRGQTQTTANYHHSCGIFSPSVHITLLEEYYEFWYTAWNGYKRQISFFCTNDNALKFQETTPMQGNNVW
jgi:hypothetical protein